MAYGNPNLLGVDASTFENNTHTWATTGGNTTLAVVTGQYLSGTYSLRATPTAAGSVELISPRWNVTAGVEYVGRIPLRTSAATSGRTATARITWFDAVSGGNSLGVSDATVPVSSASGWLPANYPCTVGTAPAGAMSATLKLTVTGLAAAEYVNTDEVYAGAGVVHPGNVYGYNTASVEMDTSGWKIDSGTMARGNWNLVTGQGFSALEVTSAAAGSQDIRTNNFIAVLPGKEYTSYVAARSPSVATTWYAEFRFYDATATQVGAAVQTPYSVPINATTWLGITATAPTGAASCKVFIRPQATAASQVFVLEDAQFYVSANPAGNLLSYAEYSTEGTLPAWTLENGTLSMMYGTSVITDGMFALKATPIATGTIRATLDRLVPVAPGTTYQVRAVIFRHNSDAAQSVISAVRCRVDWYDSTGSLCLSDNPDQFYSAEKSGEWWSQIVSETRTAPEGASFARVGFEVTSDNPLVDFYFVDNVSLMPAEAEYTLETSNDTGSVTLTVNYVPAVGSDSSNVTIVRMDEDGKSASLRGYGHSWDLAVNPYSPIVVEDYEAPLGSRIWYSIRWSDSTGATSNARLFTHSVNAPALEDGDYVWLKSPGIPALNTRVLMEAPLKWSRAARSARYDIVERKNPVHVTSTRAGRQSSVSFLVFDPEANALFDSLLDSGTAALVQAMPGYGIDGNLYVSIGDVDNEPLSPDAREDGWRWTMSITEVDRPGGGLQGSAISTWADILTAYPTWEALFSARSTWTEVLTKG